MGKHAQSVDKTILSRITGKGRGCVFTPVDFLDLANRNTVGKVLSRSVKAGTIRQLSRGLYDYPISDPRLGLIPPSTDDIAKALKDRHATRLQASGAHAANILGLSEQVPVRSVFLTDGRGRKVQLGKRQIILKQTTPRQMATAGRISGTVIQALRWIGQRQVDDRMISTLRRNLTDEHKKQLLKDLRYAPAWIAKLMRAIAETGKT